MIESNIFSAVDQVNHNQFKGEIENEIELDLDLQKNAEEFTQNAHFKIQSMADALRKVWSVEEDWRKKGPDAYDKKKEDHVPGHEDDDEKEKNGKKVKTETGKKAAKVELDPEITEKK